MILSLFMSHEFIPNKIQELSFNYIYIDYYKHLKVQSCFNQMIPFIFNYKTFHLLDGFFLIDRTLKLI